MRVMSSIPGSEWPAVPSADAARLLALQFQFERTERLPPEQLLEKQLEQAGRLLQHAHKTVPWYRERWRQAGVRPRHVPSLAQWQSIPVLHRADLQAAGDALVSTAPPPEHGAVRTLSSSGSTGVPVVAHSTALMELYWRALTLREHLWHRRNLAGLLAGIRVVRGEAANNLKGVQAQGWGVAVDPVNSSGRSAMLSITQPLDVQRRWLEETNPDYLITFPSNLEALLAAGPLTLPRLRQARTVGELVTPAQRALVQEQLGVPLVDMYSAQETGYLALECPAVPGRYHVPAEAVLLEVLDDQDQPVGPGGTGHVVVTTLHNFAMPLVRYRIGDMATVGDGSPCPCGRTLPVLERILGRARNMVRLPDGSSHWPFMGEKRFDAIVPVRQFQVMQHSLEEVELKLVVADPLTGEQEAAFQALLQEELRYPFAVRITRVDAIPRSTGGKFEDFISLVPAL